MLSDGYSYLDKVSGADIAKDIRAKVADLNDLVIVARAKDILVDYRIQDIPEEGRVHIHVRVSQEV